jgi:NAD(P)-dependent dehydrogenase (short-subunit alcohol dehydrogenase family)
MAFLELLVEGNKRREKGKPSSQIIAIGSVGGLTRFTDSFIYNASKAAVHHLMKNLGAHFVPFDVRCNVIAPGCELFFPFRPTRLTQANQWTGTWKDGNPH